MEPIAIDTCGTWSVCILPEADRTHISRYLIDSIVQALTFPNIITFISGMLFMFLTALGFPTWHLVGDATIRRGQHIPLSNVMTSQRHLQQPLLQ